MKGEKYSPLPPNSDAPPTTTHYVQFAVLRDLKD